MSDSQDDFIEFCEKEDNYKFADKIKRSRVVLQVNDEGVKEDDE